MNNISATSNAIPSATLHLPENQDSGDKISSGDYNIKNNIPSAQNQEAPVGVFKNIKERSCHRLTVVINRLKNLLTSFADWVKIPKGLFDVEGANSCHRDQRGLGSFQKTKSTNEYVPKIHTGNDDSKEEEIGNIQKLSTRDHNPAWRKFLIKARNFSVSRTHKVKFSPKNVLS